MTAPDGTGRATPDGTGVTGSDGAGTGAPGGSGTTAPDGVRTTAPGGARPTVPVRAHTSVRGGAGASAPDGAGAVTSGSAGVCAPDGADSERLARVFLSRVVEPGDETGGRWVRELGAVAVARRLREGTPRLPGVSDKRWAGLRARAERADPRRDLAAAREAGVRFLCPGDTEWPAQLDDLGDARPTGLWVRGRPHLRMWALRSVAVVGARACTEYGAHMAATLAAGLAERGWVVVSGGAYGVDGAAHRGTLAGGGATVAVLACGVDRPYPRGHTELINRVAQQGLVIGELPPGDHPTPSRFLVRNRVIAALTRGTVVVEAAHRSGSLVTARAAQRLGRHTMGVPGPATSALSAGVHELLRGGAVLVTDAAEIVELVGDMGELAPDRRGPVLPRDLLDADARQVLAALPGHGTAAPDDIARDARTTPDDVIARLYELRSLGYVERHGEGWRLTRQAVISARADRTGC
ncbi:DNA-processing protein DprA [Streptomyces mexicanus]|uniref:DNA-processing protein DprA n=1 Tax=Streptomyces mexicanus TaxID=178566 RepID=UPI003667D04B